VLFIDNVNLEETFLVFLSLSSYGLIHEP